ncbi:MAG: hypothetical protein B7Y47_14420 [Sphingomonas sp. 28-63-12]|nr:MAG: hypothetical protein B7Y47_14420 [Sphingomonas sp. 28-63-12]
MTAPAGDFLWKVAARATGASPIVQPRLTSRFEPVCAAMPADRPPVEPVIADSDEHNDVRETRAPMTKRQQIIVPSTQDNRVTAPTAANVDAPSRTIRRPASRAAARPPQPSASPAPELDRSPQPQAAAPPPIVPAEPDRSSRAVVPGIPGTQSALPPPADALGQRRDPPPRPHSGRRDFVRAEPATSLVVSPPHLPPVEPARPPATQILEVERRPIPSAPTNHRAEQRHRRGAAPLQPPTPVINITIGRVDVRAQIAATPVVAQPAPPQNQGPQSLDDYLRKRGGAR